MLCQPRVLVDHPVRKPKISVILIDWGVRESFHSLEYLNRQTVPREEYELLWLEFYNREPAGLRRLVENSSGAHPALDRWIVLGYPDELVYHKHRVYNVGLLAARGEVCVICDSDAIFTPRFIESLIRAFEQSPHAFLHVDEVRNNSHLFYPFNYPAIKEVIGDECINWHGHTTSGLLSEHDRVHRANMGACLAARRKDLLAIGGSDEHLDYLGYMCGPYELTFRLTNYHGQPERWLRDEYIYHTWHPNTSGVNTDYHGPEDGLLMSLRALDARASYRIAPYQQSPLLSRAWRRRTPNLEQVLTFLSGRPEPSWRVETQPLNWPEEAYWANRDVNGFNLFCHKGAWYALAMAEGRFDPEKYRSGGYGLVVAAGSVRELESKVYGLPNPSRPVLPGALGRLMRKLHQQPLTELPERMWRKALRLASRLGPNRRPWPRQAGA